MTLTDLEPNETGEVLKIFASYATKRRLYDIGLIPGTKTECFLKNKKGEISAYKIRGAVMALRHEDSNKIIISRRDF